MKLRYVLINLSVIMMSYISQSAQANDVLGDLGFGAPKVTVTVADPKCKISEDPYSNAVSISNTQSKLFGQCIDSNTYRPAVIINETADNVQFANYIHNNQYWVATLPKSPTAYAKAIYQVIKFPVAPGIFAAHAQLRIRLKPANTIQLQAHGDSTIKTQTNDIIFSFEAGRPKGVDYSLTQGVSDNYAIIGRVASVAQRQEEKKDSTTEQYELALSEEEIGQLAMLALKQSHDLGVNSAYNTLSPNCTTEVLDLVDMLPRFKGKYPRFLTVLSIDPIVQPSLNALKLRQLIKNKIQNMVDEVNNPNFKGDVVIKDVPATNANINFLPSVTNEPWTLVVVKPPDNTMSVDELAYIEKLKNGILQKSFEAISSIETLSYIANSSSEVGAQEILSKVFKKIDTDIRASLKRANSSLSTNMHQVGFYFVPFKSVGSTSLEKLGIQASLPVSIKSQTVSKQDKKSQEVFYYIASGARHASDVALATNTPAFLQAIAFNVRLKRDYSKYSTQILIGLKPNAKPMKMDSPEVNLSDLKIATPFNKSLRPSVLISYAGDIRTNPQETATLSFGSEGGIAGDINSQKQGDLQLLQNNGSCEVLSQSAPTLVGVFGSKAQNNRFLDPLLKGKKVSFMIEKVQLNLNQQNISDMSIKVATWPVNCMSNSDVNVKFKEKANVFITDYKKKMNKEAILDMVMSKMKK